MAFSWLSVGEESGRARGCDTRAGEDPRGRSGQSGLRLGGSFGPLADRGSTGAEVPRHREIHQEEDLRHDVGI